LREGEPEFSPHALGSFELVILQARPHRAFNGHEESEFRYRPENSRVAGWQHECPLWVESGHND